MARRLMFSVVLLALLPASAFAQPAVFFDDFDGDALLPHWNVPPPSAWEHDVSNSMLNVTGLFSPSNPKSPTNFISMGAPFAPQNDFQMDVRMGWGTSEGVGRFTLTVQINAGLIATIGYREHSPTGPPGVYAATDAGLVTIPSPPPGIYDFRISRIGSIFHFYFDGLLFASLPSAYTGPINGMSFFLSSPYPGPSGPFHIDIVQVVPVPGAFVGLLALAVSFSRRARN